MDDTAVRLLKERALESTAEGVVIVDCQVPKMPIIYVNPAFTAMTGYGADEVVGSNCRFLQGQDTSEAAKDRIRQSISRQQPCTVEILNYRKDRTAFWNRLSITPVRDETGQTTHFIGIQNDVTRRRLAEESLRQANEQLKRDLQAAANVQQSQLPQTLPEIAGFDFAWRYRPCQELAGDTLNILQIDERHVAMYVLDVSGHGVRSALQSFSVSQDLRLREGGPNLSSPLEVLGRLNLKYPVDMQTGMFFTMLYGMLDTQARTFTFACAGHPGPVLLRDGQPPEMFQVSSYPVGMAPEPGYQSQTIPLQPGDKLLLYTDGVVEAMSSRDIPFGEDRFLKGLQRNCQQPIEPLLESVMKSLENWACHVDLRDDLSLVGIEVVR